MNKVFLIKDQSSTKGAKPFVSIHTNRQKAEQRLSVLRSKVAESLKNNLVCEEIVAQDYIPQSNKVYVVMDKTDASVKTKVVGIYFDPFNAGQKVQSLRKKIPPYSHKLVFTKIEEVI